MTIKKQKFAAGVTLVEVLVAMVVLAIAALGALGYQYYAAGEARVARAQITATRTGQLLLEDWKSTGGSKEYDPTSLGLGFEINSYETSDFDFGEGMGTAVHGTVYAITVDDVLMYVMLKWQDIEHDTAAEMTLRQLGVIVIFEEGLEQSMTGSLAAYNPGIILTTYVRLDASGG